MPNNLSMSAIRSRKSNGFTVICSPTTCDDFPFVSNWTGRRTGSSRGTNVDVFIAAGAVASGVTPPVSPPGAAAALGPVAAVAGDAGLAAAAAALVPRLRQERVGVRQRL